MKPLASNNILNTLLFPAFALLVLILLTIAGVATTLINGWLVVLLFIVLIAWIFIGVKETYDVYYDSEFLYLNGVMHNHKINLNLVLSVRLNKAGMRVAGVTAWNYLVELDPNTGVMPQSVFQTPGSTTVEDFISVVRNVNPSLLVELS